MDNQVLIWLFVMVVGAVARATKGQNEYENRPLDMSRRGVFNKSPSSRWTKGIIPYYFTTEGPEAQTPEQQTEVIRVMKLYERLTCMRFKPWYNESGVTLNDKEGLDHQGYLDFITGTSCCWSFVGNLHHKQQIYCGSGTTCLHEIGHAVGMSHEQVTPDPNRNWIIRMNPENNHNGYYYTASNDSTINFGYDIQSWMHYSQWDDSKPAFTYLYPEIVAKGSYYYFMMDVDKVHGCADMYCSDSELDCQNDGYLSLIDGVCNCRCVPGLDPASGCTKVLPNDYPSIGFPRGSYAIPAPKDGCPDVDSQSGVRAFYSQESKAELKFCVTENKESDIKWPYGTYCIYRKGGTCPEGFKSGSLQFDDSPTAENVSSVSGVLPDGVYGDDTKIEFCCQRYSFPSEPIVLPRTKPFSLIKHPDFDCQAVVGMKTEKETFSFQNPTTDSIAAAEGEHPVKDASKSKYTFTFCNYRPATLGCGEIIELNPGNPSQTFSSSQGGVDYDCTWYIKAPKGENLILKFDNFNIVTDPESLGSCSDILEIEYDRPGYNGFKLCGPGNNQVYRSLNSTIRLRLNTYGKTESAFTATATLIDRQKSCYNTQDRGLSYAGQVNYTRWFEPCLPWAEVAHCPDSVIENPYLDGNSCRNPGWVHGIMPWCYTSAELCERNYCDPCGLGGIYDKALDCESRKQNGLCTNPLYETMARLECAKTCGFILSPPSNTATVTCDAPGPITDGNLETSSTEPFKVGDTVTYFCKTNPSVSRVRTCLTTGQWSPLAMVCAGENATCGDANPLCPDIVKGSPSMCDIPSAKSWCAYTCGFCDQSETPPCEVPPPTANVTTNETRTGLSRGQYIKSACKDGYEHLSGDYLRVCLASGQLSGSELNCQKFCPDGWMYWPETKSCYQETEKRLRQYQANDICITKGGLLAMPKTDKLFNALYKQFEFTSSSIFWIGLHLDSESGLYKWMDGEPLVGWTKWGDAPGEKAVRVWSYSWYPVPSYWNADVFICEIPYEVALRTCPTPPQMEDGDVLSGTKGPYRLGDIVTYKCEKSEETRSIQCLTDGTWSTLPLNRVCEICPEGWKYFYETKDCYRVYKDDVPYNTAESSCESKGGTIAMPKTKIQFGFLEEISSDLSSFWLGLTGSASNGFYTWEDGDRISGWAQTFHGGENPSISGNKCVGTWDSMWHDLECYYYFSYICQVALEVVQTTCGDPPVMEDGKPVADTQLGPYRPGDTVTYKCDTSEETRTITCLTTGQWSTLPMNRVCEICPDGWKYLGETKDCYKAFSQEVDYDTAESVCKSKGGSLPMPKTETQYKFFKEVSSGLNLVWLGLTGSATDGFYTWEDEERISGWAQTFHGGETPSISGNVCVRTWNSQWYDVPCYYSSSYICRLPLAVAQTDCGDPTVMEDGKPVPGTKPGPYRPGDTVTYKCDTSEETRTITCLTTGQWSTLPMNRVCEICPDGWKYLSETKDCYKAFSQEVHYDMAESVCKSKGGSLPMPKTETQYKFFKEVSSGLNLVWLGLTGSATDGFYTWEDGERISGWAQTFHGGETLSISGNVCVRTWYSQWYDVPCYYSSSYICRLPLAVAQTDCGDPTVMEDGKPVPDTKPGPYRPGDTVTYKCDTSEETRTITCLTSGQWSTLPMNRVCEICPEPWKYNHETGSCYRSFSDSQSFSGASFQCQSRGGSLAMPKTKSQYETVKEITAGHSVVWIGMTGDETDGFYSWVNGDRISGWAETFHGGETPSISGKQCVRIWNKDMYDWPCWDSLHYACQVPLAAVETTCPAPGVITDGEFVGDISVGPFRPADQLSINCTSTGEIVTIQCLLDGKWTVPADKACSICPDGWTFNYDSQSCYKAFEADVSYSTADANCQKDQARLATPKTKAEFQFALKMTSHLSVTWIGLTGNDQDGFYTWVTGDKLTGWSLNFYGGENPSISGTKCVRLWNSDWYSVPCWYGSSYLCQAPVQK